jgi:hypothetical protein
LPASLEAAAFSFVAISPSQVCSSNLGVPFDKCEDFRNTDSLREELFKPSGCLLVLEEHG